MSQKGHLSSTPAAIRKGLLHKASRKDAASTSAGKSPTALRHTQGTQEELIGRSTGYKRKSLQLLRMLTVAHFLGQEMRELAGVTGVVKRNNLAALGRALVLTDKSTNRMNPYCHHGT